MKCLHRVRIQPGLSFIWFARVSSNWELKKAKDDEDEVECGMPSGPAGQASGKERLASQSYNAIDAIIVSKQVWKAYKKNTSQYTSVDIMPIFLHTLS